MPKTVVRSIAILHTTPGEIFAGTESGVFRSTDQGSSWAAVNSGLATASVASLATDSSRLYASTASGLWTLSAGSWSLRSPDATGALLFASGVLYAAGSGTILRSSDGGKTWAVEPIAVENPAAEGHRDSPLVKPRP
jgi:ligand-binding sensor domain-containing protein